MLIFNILKNMFIFLNQILVCVFFFLIVIYNKDYGYTKISNLIYISLITTS